MLLDKQASNQEQEGIHGANLGKDEYHRAERVLVELDSSISVVPV